MFSYKRQNVLVNECQNIIKNIMDENEDVTNLNYTTVYNSEYECQLPCPITVLKKLIQLQKKEMTKKNVHRQLLLMDDFLAAYTTPFVSFF